MTKQCEGCDGQCTRRENEGDWDWAKRTYCSAPCFRKNLAKATYDN